MQQKRQAHVFHVSCQIFGCPILFPRHKASLADLNAKLLKLLSIHSSRSLTHQAGCILYLGECNDLPDIVTSAHQHGKAVKSIGKPCMGRHSILKSIQQKSKLLLRLLLCKSKHLI